jgi:hypothetical protein
MVSPPVFPTWTNKILVLLLLFFADDEEDNASFGYSSWDKKVNERIDTNINRVPRT